MYICTCVYWYIGTNRYIYVCIPAEREQCTFRPSTLPSRDVHRYICICMYTCIYIHLCIQTNTCIYTCIYVNMNIYMYVHIHVCMPAACEKGSSLPSNPHTATHCNTLQHTATHCNTLQHTATHCNTLQHTATH